MSNNSINNSIDKLPSGKKMTQNSSKGFLQPQRDSFKNLNNISHSSNKSNM